MKFSFQSLPNCKARHGKLFDFLKFPERVYETPLVLLSTKGGSVPHITHEVFQLLTKDLQIVQFPLPSTILSYEAVKEYAKGIAHFSGLKDYLAYCSVQDPSFKTPVGYNKQNEVSVWAHTGRKAVNADDFMDTIEAFQPDMYQILANTDTNSESTRKKVTKTIQSSNSLFEKCLKRHQESNKLKNTGVVGIVGGGFDIELRQIQAKFMASTPVDGFSIEGFHNNGPEVESMNYDSIIPVLEETLKILPEDKFRILHGCWKPHQVLKMVEMGVDLFDSSLPFIVTERMSAFSFNWKPVSINSEEVSNVGEYEISLKDSRFKEDFGPLKSGCTCLPCRKHTRAYVYHLVENKELLSSVLLMMHNLHQYMEFFKSIRDALRLNQKLIIL